MNEENRSGCRVLCLYKSSVDLYDPPHAYLQLVLCYLSSICFMADGVCGATRSGLRLTYSRRVSAENTDPGLQKHVC